MCLKQNNYKGIVSRDTFYAVKAEFARRNAGRAPSQKLAPSGRSCYSTKYALTERLVCGECGTLYCRCMWTKRGEKFAAWHCTSRVDNGTKYCHYSPTLRENSLQAAILAAVNDAMSQREVLVDRIAGAMRVKLVSLPGECLNLSDIERQLDGLNQRRFFPIRFQTLPASKSGDERGRSNHLRRSWRRTGRLTQGDILAQLAGGQTVHNLFCRRKPRKL